jgi:hypothetical protein
MFPCKITLNFNRLFWTRGDGWAEIQAIVNPVQLVLVIWQVYCGDVSQVHVSLVLVPPRNGVTMHGVSTCVTLDCAQADPA